MGGPLREGAEAVETLAGVEGLMKRGPGARGGLGQRKRHRALWRSRAERTNGQESGTYSVGIDRSGQGCEAGGTGSHLSFWDYSQGTHPAYLGSL